MGTTTPSLKDGSEVRYLIEEECNPPPSILVIKNNMKKELFITANKPNYTYPMIFDTYDKAMAFVSNPETHALLRVLIDIPEPEQTVEATEFDLNAKKSL